MATEIRGEQIKDGSVKRADLNTATSGSAVVRKIVAGTGISLSSTGADAGTGDVTVNATGGSGSFAKIASGTLGSSAATLTVSSIPAREYLKVLIYVQGTDVSDKVRIRFNSDTGNNYSWSVVTNANSTTAVVVRSTTDNYIQLQSNSTNSSPFYATLEIYNKSGEVKQVTGTSNASRALGGTQDCNTIAGIWDNTASQISAITVSLVSDNNLNTGTQMIIFGEDYS